MPTGRRRTRLRTLEEARLTDVRGGVCQKQFDAMIAASRGRGPGSIQIMATAVGEWRACTDRVILKK